MEEEPTTTIFASTIECPELPVTLTEEHLASLQKALKSSIKSTTEAFYSYLKDRDRVPEHLRTLFDQTVDADNTSFWVSLRRQFARNPEAFSQRMMMLSEKLTQDKRFELYFDEHERYTLSLPILPRTKRPNQSQDDYFYASCLNLFYDTRLRHAEQALAQTIDTGEGRRLRNQDQGAPYYFFEFDETQPLYDFINHCLPTGLGVSFTELQQRRN